VSTVSKKIVMATTGAVLVAYLVAHVAGNLKIFFGPGSFDGYAAWLRRIGEPVLPGEGFLWLQRVVLVLAVGLHIWAATALTVAARRARPVRYRHRLAIQGSYAARTMRWGGVIIALFVVYHLLDLTTRDLNPAGSAAGTYAAVARDFAPGRWYVTAFYALAIVALGLHLRHGIWSAFQTLGLRFADRYGRPIALVVSVLLCAGFLAVPVAVTIGVVK
jgi:succinate dehydrogenase / fumarate reductase cytochrome b subunit